MRAIDEWLAHPESKPIPAISENHKTKDPTACLCPELIVISAAFPLLTMSVAIRYRFCWHNPSLNGARLDIGEILMQACQVETGMTSEIFVKKQFFAHPSSFSSTLEDRRNEKPGRQPGKSFSSHVRPQMQQ